MRHRGSLILGAVLAGSFLALALISFVWTPYPYAAMDIAARLKPPGPVHWLGTDQFGRDVAAQLMVGARTSIMVAIVAVAIGIAGGVPLGLWAAANRGRWVDEIIQRGSDLVFAFPAIVTAILITSVFGPSALNAILAIGIFNIPVFARVTRAGAISLWTLDYIRAAQVAGKRPLRISVEHV
ncbi:MAG: ABC transporter permease, partial [Paracoccaceae bacterium]|nr:ABC transporter permease [Paracoccaceae bacterium]